MGVCGEGGRSARLRKRSLIGASNCFATETITGVQNTWRTDGRTQRTYTDSGECETAAAHQRAAQVYACSARCLRCGCSRCVFPPHPEDVVEEKPDEEQGADLGRTEREVLDTLRRARATGA